MPKKKDPDDFSGLTPLTSIAAYSATQEIQLLCKRAHQYMEDFYPSYPKELLNSIFAIAYELVDYRAKGKLGPAENSRRDIEEELRALQQSQKVTGREEMSAAIYHFVDVALELAMEETGRLTNIADLATIKQTALEARGLVLEW